MKIAKLGDICEIISGSTPATNVPEYWNGDYNWVAPNELKEDKKYIFSTNKKITQLAVEKTRLKLLPKGTVLLSSRAPIGKVAIAAEPMYCNQGFKNLICSDKINNDYLYWNLISKKGYLQSIGRGATFKELSKELVSNIEIFLPDIIEQRRIAAILDKADAIIRKRKQCISMLDELVKARFVEIFGDYEDGKKIQLGEICSFIRNGVNIKQKPNSHGIPITRIETISNGEFNFDRFGYADIENIKKYMDYKLIKGDLLISHINSRAYLGRVVQYKGNYHQDIIHGMNLLCARLIDGYSPTFIEWYCKTQSYKKYISCITKDAVNQSSFNITDYSKLPIPKLSLSLQNKFEKYVNKMYETKSIMKTQLQESETLKSALLQKYFSQGEN